MTKMAKRDSKPVLGASKNSIRRATKEWITIKHREYYNISKGHRERICIPFTNKSKPQTGLRNVTVVLETAWADWDI
jgi:hypothetical protein